LEEKKKKVKNIEETMLISMYEKKKKVKNIEDTMLISMYVIIIIIS